MGLSDDCALIGRPDWLPTPAEIGGPCAAGRLYGAPDYGAQAATTGVPCDSNRDFGGEDFDPFGPLDFPGSGGLLQYGYPDFTPLPAIDIIGTLPLAQFGAPDFTIDTGETGLSLSGSDLELGRRLNWPTAWTRIGKVFFHDSPDSSTPHMELASVGAGASATVDNTRANSKSYSYKLTTGAGVGHTASVYRDFPGTPSMKIGFGLWFWYDGTDDHISFTIRHLSGTELTVLGLVFYPASKEWFYLDNAGVEQTLGTLSPDPTQLLGWHFIQLVVDLTAQAYVRVVAGTTLQVLTASGQVTPDATTGPELRIITTIRDDVGVGMDWWVDDIILTYDEL